MWRADRRQDAFVDDPAEAAVDPVVTPAGAARPEAATPPATPLPESDDATPGVAIPAQNLTQPHTLSLGDPNLRPANAAEPTWQQWRRQIASLGGPSPLIHFVDTSRTRIELSTTHPGGLARFITGRPTMLSNLIRDELALRTARLAAGEIVSKGVELAAARGIDAVHLGIGVVTWVHDAREYRAPILLRPLAIRRHGRDFELKLRGETELNPGLAAALAEQFGIVLDADSFVKLSDDNGAFKPNAVIDRLRGLTSHLDEVRIAPRLIVSTFADVAGPMTLDAGKLSHPLLDAMAGNSTARWAVQEAFRPVEPAHPDHREPTTDTLLLDADTEQEQVIVQIAAGNSVVVKTLPGTGATQTIVNALGTLVAQHKRVLVVSPRRASLRGIAQRFGDVGLPGLAVSPRTLRRDVVRAISRAERATQPSMGDIDDALVRLRKVLVDYRGALSKPDAVLGVSVLDCLTELSRLSLLPEPPSTSARLGPESVESLATGRGRAAETMVKAASLGEFKYGPGDSPWYGAKFASGDEASRAHGLAKRLHEETLPRLLVRAGDLVGSTPLRPFRSISELGIYLRLLTDLRDTLDRFLPAVFDRSVNELVAATAPRREAPEMTGGNRRRLRKLAKEYVRPGVHVGDLYDALTRIQQQRVLWQRFATPGAEPAVPVGIGDVQVLFQQVVQDLTALDEPLARAGRTEQLTSLPLDELTELVSTLAAESDVLDNLQERAELMTELRELDLGDLIRDLAGRHVPDEQVPAELELAWWKSALEGLLEGERALLGADTRVLDRLEADFRLVDEAHAAGSAGLLGWSLAENWKIGLVDWPEESQALKQLLRRPAVSSRDLQIASPHLSRAVAPIWLASPYEVHEITDVMPFDTVVLVDAGATTLAETVGAIRRAKQVVAFGDPVTQTPAPFRTGLDEPAAVDREPGIDPGYRDLDAWHADSALARLGTLLPTMSLGRSYRAGGEDLAELVNRRFYGGKIDALPWAGTFLGHPSITVEHIRGGHGMPDERTGSVESVDAEVERVVRLVALHAEQRPQESLMVITASHRHAIRVRSAVLRSAQNHTALNEFVLDTRSEGFAVFTVEEAVAQSRDRVLFSVGFGRTPHGRVLSNFGALGEPGGERLLAVAMTRARRALTIITCVAAADIEAGRMQHGALALAGILDDIAAREAAEYTPDDGDPMLVDLARRLQARGVRVGLGHRGKLGLVASNGGVCVTVESDATLLRSSLRESLRLRPDVLRRLGWHYLRVHAFELFSDPDGVADRVCEVLGVARGAITEEIAIVPTSA